MNRNKQTDNTIIRKEIRQHKSNGFRQQIHSNGNGNLTKVISPIVENERSYRGLIFLWNATYRYWKRSAGAST